MSEAFSALPRDVQGRLLSASEWHRRITLEPTLELSPEFLAWIADLANRIEYNAVVEAFGALDELSTAPEFLALRRASLVSAERLGMRPRKPRTLLFRIAAAFLVTAGIGSTFAYNYWRADLTYQTDVGERRVVALPDGSRVSLDSDTEVQVRYTDAARLLELQRGRARFDVVHDVSRPFSVKAGTETVVAVGTSFDVERLGPKVLVTLIQGHVVIKHSDTPIGLQLLDPQLRRAHYEHSVSLSAGEQLVASDNKQPAIGKANVQSATAWETGRLIFSDEPLSEAATRVNRYTEHPISIDADVAGIRVSGIFNAGDIGSFVNAVTTYLPVQATTDSNNNITLQRKS